MYIFIQNLYSALSWNIVGSIHSLHSCWTWNILLFFSEVLIILGVSVVVCLGSSQVCGRATPGHSQGCPSTTLCCSGRVTTGLENAPSEPSLRSWVFLDGNIQSGFDETREAVVVPLLVLFSLLWSDWTHWLCSCIFHLLSSTWNNYKMNWHIMLNAKIY